MSSKLPLGVALGLAALLAVGYGAGTQASSQAQPAKGEDAKSKRIAYVVKYGSAKELAQSLGKYFKGDVEIQVVPDGASNVLLINTAPAAFEEVLATLAKLDRRPQLIGIDIYVLEVATHKGGDGKLAPVDVDEKELAGPADRVLNNIQALHKKGTFTSLRRLTLTALENQTTSLLNGVTKPYVTGVHKTANGPISYSISYKNTGSNIVVTPRIGADNLVLLEIRLEDARMFQPEDGVPLGMNDKGQPVLATDFAVTNLNAKLAVQPGQAVLPEGVETKSKSGPARTLVVVTARVLQ
jgi:type II secretory pathway component GspD/PulD (secretin)